MSLPEVWYRDVEFGNRYHIVEFREPGADMCASCLQSDHVEVRRKNIGMRMVAHQRLTTIPAKLDAVVPVTSRTERLAPS